MKLSPIFPMSVKPVNDGVYRITFKFQGEKKFKKWFSFWNGEYWNTMHLRPVHSALDGGYSLWLNQIHKSTRTCPEIVGWQGVLK